MQVYPSNIISNINNVYIVVYGTLSPVTMVNVQKEFYWCQHGLRQRGIMFRQNWLDGKWFLDKEGQRG